ncbi:hypothetical protein JCM3770_000125 [Rhodotorula araucariae]
MDPVPQGWLAAMDFDTQELVMAWFRYKACVGIFAREQVQRFRHKWEDVTQWHAQVTDGLLRDFFVKELDPTGRQTFINEMERYRAKHNTPGQHTLDPRWDVYYVFLRDIIDGAMLQPHGRSGKLDRLQLERWRGRMAGTLMCTAWPGLDSAVRLGILNELRGYHQKLLDPAKASMLLGPAEVNALTREGTVPPPQLILPEWRAFLNVGHTSAPAFRDGRSCPFGYLRPQSIWPVPPKPNAIPDALYGHGNGGPAMLGRRAARYYRTTSE